MSKKIPNSTQYKIICPLCLLVTFFILIFFIFNCSDPVKKNSTNISKDSNAPVVDDALGNDFPDSDSADSDFKDDRIVDDAPSTEGATEEEEASPRSSKNFDINDLKNLQYLGDIINAEQTLKVAGGFYDPRSINPQTINEVSYKAVIKGYTGEYLIRELKSDENKDKSIKNIYKDNSAVTRDGVFHLHQYSNDYKKASDTPSIKAYFLNIKKNNIATVRGRILVDLMGNGTEALQQLRIWVGDENKDGIILGKDDIIQSGIVFIRYGTQKKKYVIDHNLSSDDKAKLQALNFFKFTN